MSVVEDFSGIDVDDMLQLRNKKEKKKKKKNGHAFAYVFDLCMPSKFVVDNET